MKFFIAILLISFFSACSNRKFHLPIFATSTQRTTGSNFFKTVATWKWKQRDSLAVQEILAGNIPLKFPVYIRSADANAIFAQAFFAVDRNLLGISYGKGNVSDDVQISIHLYAKK